MLSSPAQGCATPSLALQHADRLPRSHLCYLAGGEPVFPLGPRKTASADTEISDLCTSLGASAPRPSPAEIRERSRRANKAADRGAGAVGTQKAGNHSQRRHILAVNAGLNPAAALAAAIAASKTTQAGGGHKPRDKPGT